MPIAGPFPGNLTCHESQYFNVTVNECVDCNVTMPGCIKCVNSTFCQACIPEARFVDGVCVIVAGPPACSATQYLDVTLNQCLNCADALPNCISCLNATTCVACAENYTLLNGTCLSPIDITCPVGTYLDLDTFLCVNCSNVLPGCIACENETLCARCAAGYNLIDGRCVIAPIDCWPGTYYDPDTNQCLNCSEAIPNCTLCLNSSICLNCTDDNMLLNGTCIPMGTPECPEGTFYDPAWRRCVACNISLPNCTRCRTSTVCDECAPGNVLVGGNCLPVLTPSPCGIGFFNYSGVCRPCTNFIPNCLACINETYCTNCAENYIPINGACVPRDIEGNVGNCPNGTFYDPVSIGCVACSSVLANCKVCENATYCLECEPGNTLTDGFCMPGLEAPRDKCPPGTYNDSVSGQCVPCGDAMANCTRCENSSVCLKCAPKYWLINGTCTAIMDVPCLYGYYRDSNTLKCKKCSSAIPFCIDCINETTCTNCSGNYTVVNGSCVYPNARNSTRRRLRILQEVDGSCKYGYYLKKGKCYKCPKECKGCKSVGKYVICLSCEKGYYRDGWGCKKCSSSILSCLICYDASRCLSCGYGYFKLDNRTCAKCSKYLKNCVHCDNSTHCVVCRYPYNLNDTTGQCDFKESYCIKEDKSGWGCAECAKGYYLSWDKNCYPCHPTCSACTGYGYDMCTSCKGDMKLRTTPMWNTGYCSCDVGYRFDQKQGKCVPA